MIGKKIHAGVAVAIMLALAGFVGAGVYLQSRSVPSVSDTMTRAAMGPESEVSAPKAVETPASPAPAAATVEAGYKSVRVSDGTSAFSFQVPEKWLVETRHSGERTLSVDEMRDYLATSYRGDAKKDLSLYSSYSDRSWKEIRSMTEQQVRDAFFETDPSHKSVFPAASVSGGDVIQYTDTSWDQVDFYFVDGSPAGVAAKNRADDAKRYGPGGTGASWKRETVAGMSVEVKTYPIDHDEAGKEVATKAGSGGKEYYVPVSGDNGTLVIFKQVRGEAAFESGFSRLLSTLRFE